MSVALRYSIGGARASELVKSVERGIREGRLGPNQPLPTVRALAAELKLAPATVAAAYRTLRQRGLVASDGRRGTRVGQRPPLIARRPAPETPPGMREIAAGNPDPAFLPRLPRLLARSEPRSRLYGDSLEHPELLRLAARQLAADGVATGALAVMGGALDGIERVLQAHLKPGDRVAVEDPGYTGILDLVAALGLVPEPVALDDSGPLPKDLGAALRRGARALILTPRAQNPTGAALDKPRTAELRAALARHPDTLVVEDDHAGPVAGGKAFTLTSGRARWAVVRSVSKSLGPDLRLAILAGDPETVARVQGRQSVGAGWVSTILQDLVAKLWKDAGVARLLLAADTAYTDRRERLIQALDRRGVRAFGRSGLNVWIPVVEESAAVTALAALGWAVRAGERYRVRSGPAIRVTSAALRAGEVERLAADIAAAVQRRQPVA